MGCYSLLSRQADTRYIKRKYGLSEFAYLILKEKIKEKKECKLQLGEIKKKKSLFTYAYFT